MYLYRWRRSFNLSRNALVWDHVVLVINHDQDRLTDHSRHTVVIVHRTGYSLKNRYLPAKPALSVSCFIDMKHEDRYFKVAPGVWGMKIIFVNVYAISSDSHWVLIDAGLHGSANRILRMADDLFNGVAPSAIILTHGHFDHRGAIPELLKSWSVPVFAHKLELPYLTGRSAYPPPDPTVGGGLMSALSFLYPREPVDLSAHIEALPEACAVRFLPEWRTIHVPGHAPGQIALFREADKLLIAADAFVTTHQESLVATLGSLSIISGPPKYFTYDWKEAYSSVNKLKQLSPRKVATGHGPPMYGKPLQKGLEKLTTEFDQLARPAYGRYVDTPAVADHNGIQYVPPPKIPVWIIAFCLAAIAGVALCTKTGNS